ncbi:MAG: pantoate--beta-alanine ligase [Alphaproteobacteria bacterium]|nr:pantoate--beta-alanine ligase [Alphaproteobacteria bacterium]
MTSLPTAPLPIVRTVADLRIQVAAWKRAGLRVGLVPTMGALHAGHLSLVTLIKSAHDKCVASLFVNPKQFAAHEDLDRYPRNEAGDAALLQSAGCDLLFAPTTDVMYPPGFATAVTVSGVSAPLEGEKRPQFFGGVATVVSKLLLQSLPDAAAFGEKDYQQLLVIKKMVKDLDIPVEILAGETVREADGLAMSSRNAYLTPEQRKTAGQLNVIARAAIAAIESGGAIAPALARAEADILAAGFSSIDYVALHDTDAFARIDTPTLTIPARLLVAVQLGATRLIDNFAVTPE